MSQRDRPLSLLTDSGHGVSRPVELEGVLLSNLGALESSGGAVQGLHRNKEEADYVVNYSSSSL